MRPGAKLDLTTLELFAAVADTGSLGQAAARAGLTQPAVSSRMTVLERTLALRLLERDPSGTRLTPAGVEILAAARALLSAADRLATLASRLNAESAARLRVAASFTVAEYLAPAWVETLRAEMPGVSLTLEVENSTQVLAALEKHRADIGFVEGPDPLPAGFASQDVAQDDLVVVVAPGHPWVHDGVVDGKELSRTELIVRERGSGTREVLEAALMTYGGVRSRLELGSSAAVLGAARRGEGPAVISRLAAEMDLSAGSLRLVAVTGLDLSRVIRAVWSLSNPPGPVAQRLLAAAHQPLRHSSITY